MSRKRNKRKRGARYTQDESGFKPRKLTARTANQKTLIKAIRTHDIVLCSGPAGTGKTHIAVGSAVAAFRQRKADRIILSRPVVGVGNDIGYLPGTLEDKIGPYLVPLFDELGYYVERKRLTMMLAEKQLEIVPLSMMRGRTFNDSYVILDEAQNATMAELRMMLTRLGQNSTMILVGDLQQSDLPQSAQGDFRTLIDRLSGLEGIGVCRLTQEDIVRHQLIAQIEDRLCQNTRPDSQTHSSESTKTDVSLGGQSATLLTSGPTADSSPT
jgi:phosphate starvation-inducible PhoH-like protein